MASYDIVRQSSKNHGSLLEDATSRRTRKVLKRIFACVGFWRSRLLRLSIQCASSSLVVAITYLGSGICFFQLQEGWSMVDSLYFLIAVMTTVGYGDVRPVTLVGKLGTCFFAVMAAAIAAGAIRDVLNAPSFLKAQADSAVKRPGICLLDGRSMTAYKRACARRVLSICGVWLILGTAVGKYIIGLVDMVDAVYFATVTLTTVGFGDIVVPSQPLPRVCVLTLMGIGVPIFGVAVARCKDLLQESGHWTCRDDGILRITRTSLDWQCLSRLQQFSQDMARSSATNNQAVTREDFLVFVLIHNGILRKEDVHHIWEDFARLETSGTGDLTKIRIDSDSMRASQVSRLAESIDKSV